MTFLLTFVSIIVIAVLVRQLATASPFKVCALCAGVFLTWCGLIALRYLGYAIDPVIPAILMGGSAVGIAFQLEKRLARGRSPLVWKTLFVLAGFTAAYGLVSSQWPLFLLAAVILSVGAFASARPTHAPGKDERHVRDLEKKLENCC